jgi:hypothetical protein
VAELMTLPAPPISVISSDASFEQSTTGFTVANGVFAALPLSLLLLLPLLSPHAATTTVTTQAANTASNRLGFRALM